ncbi:MAG: hypothetical protein JW965_06475 [Bacteroidales bacterium]|nr:hypothetical protein [Bacteroidales bacterium]
MKKYNIIYLVLVSVILIFACTKEEEKSERFKILTGQVWRTDSLLADGQDASGPGGFLEKMAGDAEFLPDGTGYFGQYTGSWYFMDNETKITISSPSLGGPLDLNILELTRQSFKITTRWLVDETQGIYFTIRMTFKPKYMYLCVVASPS